jgi:hypothetical protein
MDGAGRRELVHEPSQHGVPERQFHPCAMSDWRVGGFAGLRQVAAEEDETRAPATIVVRHEALLRDVGKHSVVPSLTTPLQAICRVVPGRAGCRSDH